MKRTLIASSAAAHLLMALAAASAPLPVGSQPTVSPTQQAPAKQVPAQPDQKRTTKRVRVQLRGALPTRGDTRRAGPGWSNKHVQRTAAKAKNTKRGRKSARG